MSDRVATVPCRNPWSTTEFEHHRACLPRDGVIEHRSFASPRTPPPRRGRGRPKRCAHVEAARLPPEFEGRHELDGLMQVDELPAALRENLLAREEAAARSAAELLARGRQMLGLGKGVIAARSQAMEDELDPLEKHEAENYEASWDAHIRRQALAAALKRTYEAGWEKGGGKGKGGNDASDEKGPETPNGTETSNCKGEGKSKGKETTDATETVSHVD